MTQKYVVRLSADERKILFQLLKEGSSSKEKQNSEVVGLGWTGFDES